MTRKQWRYKMARKRLKVVSSFGYEFGDAWKWSEVESISQIKVTAADQPEACFYINMKSGKSIEIETDLTLQFTTVPGVFYGTHDVPAGSQTYFENPCEKMEKLKAHRKNLRSQWVSYKPNVHDAQI